jgi:hypothetical protein
MTADGIAARARISTVTIVLAALTATACRSPEGERTRGGGPGADVRNRGPVVQMHAGSRMYYETPCLLPEERCTGPRPASGLPGDFPAPK